MTRPLISDRTRAAPLSSDLGADAELLNRIIAGDSDAFATLLGAMWRPLVLFCARILDVRENAEDIAQDAFVRFWENRSRWKLGSSPRALVYTIARNLALNDRKATTTRERRLAMRALATRGAAALPDERAEAREFRSALERAIADLPDRKREVLMLSRIDGLSRSEIASVTGLSEQTVANYLVAALSALRHDLASFLNE